jgi:hypothetical protein
MIAMVFMLVVLVMLMMLDLFRCDDYEGDNGGAAHAEEGSKERQ